MATITSKSIIKTLIENDGIYPGDEDKPVVKIVQYATPQGDTQNWGLVYEHEASNPVMFNRYELDANCIDPVVIFRRVNQSKYQYLTEVLEGWEGL